MGRIHIIAITSTKSRVTIIEKTKRRDVSNILQFILYESLSSYEFYEHFQFQFCNKCYSKRILPLEFGWFSLGHSKCSDHKV